MAAKSALNSPPSTILRRRSDSTSSIDSHSSGSSHSSHSSYAARHPDRVPSKAAPIHKPFLSILALLFIIIFYHLSGLWLFVKGFLLTRVELQGQNQCFKEPLATWIPPPPPVSFNSESLLAWSKLLVTGNAECTLPESHSKAVVIIIDALRYDFIAPIPSFADDNSWRPNPYYHAKLNVPSEIHATDPSNSFLAHFAADPPTTTLQRLKGLTTGSLPTFIEAGANFGATGRVLEDNWIHQLRAKAIRQGASINNTGLVFAGDDTWMSVFPSVFDDDKASPFDSFNVEDLDTVDSGVEFSLLPFLQPNHPNRTDLHSNWRLLIGHMLGVDHVGHRFGASHPKMQIKMSGIQLFLQNVTDAIDDDTLVIVMGDHGMDEHGDHGGDGELEIGAGIWIWSRSGFEPTSSANAVVEHDDQNDLASAVTNTETQQLFPPFTPFSPLPSPPVDQRGYRSVPQIDLVPSLSLLLGLPIPFNNLGSIVPELFPNSDRLLRAVRINSQQIKAYLDKYATESTDLAPFAAELDQLWLKAIEADARFAATVAGSSPSSSEQLQIKHAQTAVTKAYFHFNRVSLMRARSVWAQFDFLRIYLGLTVLTLSLVSCWVLWYGTKNGLQLHLETASKVGQKASNLEKPQNGVPRRSKTCDELRKAVTDSIMAPTFIGGIGGVIAYLAQNIFLSKSHLRLSVIDLVLFLSATLSQIALIFSHLPALLPSLRFDPAMTRSAKVFEITGFSIPFLHAALFASNSFTFWEDRAVLVLLMTVLLIRFVLSFGAPTFRLKLRMPLLAGGAMLLARLASISRVCRQEQAPYCQPTFYASDPIASSDVGAGGIGVQAALNSPYTIAACYFVAVLVPFALSRGLASSKSNVGVAPLFFNWILRPTLLAGAGYWLADWAIPLSFVPESMKPTLKWLKNLVAKADLLYLLFGAVPFWIFSPLCLEVRPLDDTNASSVNSSDNTPEKDTKPKYMILGFANSLGSGYLLFVSIGFSIVFLATQPSGQLAFAACLVALLMLVELTDNERDCQILVIQQQQQQAQKQPPSLQNNNDLSISNRSRHPSTASIVSLILISYLCFFATGHQSTFSSIQWRVAFIGFPTVTYPYSPLLVIINSFGHLLLFSSISIPLLILWNLSPRKTIITSKLDTPNQLFSSYLIVIGYHSLLLVSVASFASLMFSRHLMLFNIWVPRFLFALVTLVLTELGLVVTTLAVWQVGNKVNTTFGSEFE